MKQILAIMAIILLMSAPVLAQDTDSDGVPDVDDNCSSMPNGTELGTCVQVIGGIFKGTGVTCTDSIECGLNDFCDLAQLDFNGNGIGDACECHGAFDNDNDIDGTDAYIFKMGFGRSTLNNPCPASIGIPCPEGMIDCGDRCVDPMRDREYCGASEECIDGTICVDGEICVSGTCVINCPSNLTECSGLCVDTDTDEGYCGGCANPCGGGEVCVGGNCILNCPPGLTECSGMCVDTDTDEGYCGSCTNSCTDEEKCVSGTCELCITYPYGCDAAVPKTGQTTSYATGDDGDLEKGVTWPNPRFTDNGDGTVTDNLTGLIWLKNANCFGERTWDNALSDCNGLSDGSCGLTDDSSAGDWRLPNRKELVSLIHYGYYLPAVPDTLGTGQWSEGDPFTNVEFNYYWSSTTLGNAPGNIWGVHMDSAYMNSLSHSNSSYVWAVRGGCEDGGEEGGYPAPVEKTGQTTSYAPGDDGDLQKGIELPNPRFTDNGDGTVTDNLTELIWLKDASCFGTSGWTTALSECNGLSSGMCGLTDGSSAGDWRLPNRKELISLIHDGYSMPSLSNTAGTGQWSEGDPFTNLPFGIHWSSTTSANNTDRAYYLALALGGYGSGSTQNKSYGYYVWPVRGGH